MSYSVDPNDLRYIVEAPNENEQFRRINEIMEKYPRYGLWISAFHTSAEFVSAEMYVDMMESWVARDEKQRKLH